MYIPTAALKALH